MLFGFIISDAQIQIEDSKLKYHKVHWFIILPESKSSISDSYQNILVNERKLYEYKSETKITQVKEQNKPSQMYGTLTFLESTDALTYYTKLITTIKESNVIYAKIDLTENSHHWANDKIEPDIILGQTILGDIKQIEILNIS